ncbi:hypothetical protein [Microcystis phage Mwe-JY26]
MPKHFLQGTIKVHNQDVVVTVTRNRIDFGGITLQDAIVSVGPKSVNATGGGITRALGALVPDRWGNAPIEAWAPFVEKAIERGVL